MEKRARLIHVNTLSRPWQNVDERQYQAWCICNDDAVQKRMENDLRDRRLIEGVLANSALMRGATAAQVVAVAAQCRALPVRRNDVVVECSARLPGIIAVAYGTLKLSLCTPGNQRRVLRLIKAGETFGEAAALTGRPSPYEVRALSECKLVVVPSAAILAALERDPLAARQVLQLLAERYFELVGELESAAVRRGAQRLASYLDSLAERGSGNGMWAVRLPATKTVVASRLDMKKETLSRLLKQLATQGLISVAGQDITILDRARLAALSSGQARGA